MYRYLENDDLEGMAGQDASGHAGLRHDVDNHYKRLVGFGLLTSVFSAAFQLSQTRRGSVLGYPSPAETAGSAIGGNISQLGADVTRRNLNSQPNIKVPMGYRFNIRVNRICSLNCHICRPPGSNITPAAGRVQFRVPDKNR